MAQVKDENHLLMLCVKAGEETLICISEFCLGRVWIFLVLLELINVCKKTLKFDDVRDFWSNINDSRNVYDIPKHFSSKSNYDLPLQYFVFQCYGIFHLRWSDLLECINIGSCDWYDHVTIKRGGPLWCIEYS